VSEHASISDIVRNATTWFAERWENGQPVISPEEMDEFFMRHGAFERRHDLLLHFIKSRTILPTFRVGGPPSGPNVRPVRKWTVQMEAVLMADRLKALESANAPPAPLEQTAPTPETRRPDPKSALASVSDLAAEYGVGKSALDSALRRFAARYPDCREEITNRKPREPRFMYRRADVQPVLERFRRDGRTDGRKKTGEESA
jgi:hypothetical protein